MNEAYELAIAHSDAAREVVRLREQVIASRCDSDLRTELDNAVINERFTADRFQVFCTKKAI